MPDKKTLEKAKKAGEESEDEMQEAMPPEEEMPMGDDMGAEMGADMGDDMGMGSLGQQQLTRGFLIRLG